MQFVYMKTWVISTEKSYYTLARDEKELKVDPTCFSSAFDSTFAKKFDHNAQTQTTYKRTCTGYNFLDKIVKYDDCYVENGLFM